jgi:hypothetical protein
LAAAGGSGSATERHTPAESIDANGTKLPAFEYRPVATHHPTDGHERFWTPVSVPSSEGGLGTCVAVQVPLVRLAAKISRIAPV